MKVLYVNSSASGYGGEICLLEMVSRLSAKGIEPLVILPEEGILTKKLSEKGISYRIMPLAILSRQIFKPDRFIRFGMNFLPSIICLSRIIKTERIELVHSNTSLVISGAIAAKLSRIPHIWHIREIFDCRFGIFRLFLKYFILIFSTRLICISEAVRKKFPKDDPRINVVYDGVDINLWNLERKENRILERFGIKPEEIVIAMVGRINYWKGQDVFIRAAKIVVEEFPESKFLVIGDYLKEYAGIAGRLFQMVDEYRLKDKVIFTGYLDRENVLDIMASVDIVVHTSKRPEPFGGVIIEAMAVNKPVIATASGGPLETVEDKVTGILIPPKNFRAMASAIISLIQKPNLRKDMGRLAREKTTRYFNIDNTIRQIELIYRGTRGF